MNRRIEELIENYQVRKTDREKIDFITWLKKETDSMGYNVKIDKYSNHGRNLVFGDLNKAKVILTAHYDTQPNGFLLKYSFMSNPFMLVASEIFSYAVILLIFIIVEIILNQFLSSTKAHIIAGVLLIGYIVQSLVGYKNKHTLNDNTSGVATIMSIMEELDKLYRDNVAFVFFDHEELGFLGSKNFKSRYYKLIKNKPLINFDCVANGNYLFFITKKNFRETAYNKYLETAVKDNFKELDNKKALLEKSSKIIYTSDQILFDNSVAVTAMKRNSVLGYYLDRIHSQFDTVFQEENIEILKKTMIDFIKLSS